MNRRAFLKLVGVFGAVAAGNEAGVPEGDRETKGRMTMARSDSSTRKMIRSIDNHQALINPDMGWVFHYYDNSLELYGSKLEPWDTVDDFPGLSVVYFRLPWSYLEPQEGRFEWSLVDAPAQRWIDKGKKVAFLFSCSEHDKNGTPEWVREAGARVRRFGPDGMGLWEPDFDDPVFLAKLDHFLEAVAARYDGSSDVAFIDVGSFGVWGEGHTYHSTNLPYSADTIRRHIDLHIKHFKKTLLTADDDFASQDRGISTIHYAAQNGLTLRDCSILHRGGKQAYLSAEMAPLFWPRVPVVLESEHYGLAVQNGTWEDGSKYLEAVEAYHASYVSIHWWPREFLEGCRELIERINMRLGYRLQLVEASWPRCVPVSGSFEFQAVWRNAGVAPCYPGGLPALTLKDENGGILGVFPDAEFDMRSLQVGSPYQVPARSQRMVFHLPGNIAAGKYDVFISVGDGIGTPRIALPLDGNDGMRRYHLGEVGIVGSNAAD